jgi:hypothetical protein
MYSDDTNLSVSGELVSDMNVSYRLNIELENIHD